MITIEALTMASMGRRGRTANKDRSGHEMLDVPLGREQPLPLRQVRFNRRHAASLYAYAATTNVFADPTHPYGKPKWPARDDLPGKAPLPTPSAHAA